MSVAWSTGVQLLVFFCSSVPVVLFEGQALLKLTLEADDAAEWAQKVSDSGINNENTHFACIKFQYQLSLVYYCKLAVIVLRLQTWSIRTHNDSAIAKLRVCMGQNVIRTETCVIQNEMLV